MFPISMLELDRGYIGAARKITDKLDESGRDTVNYNYFDQYRIGVLALRHCLK